MAVSRLVKGLEGKLPVHPRLRLAHEGKGIDEEFPKAMAHDLPQQVSAQSLRRLLLLEALEGLLEYGGELRGRGHLITPISARPTAFKREEKRREGGGGLSLKDGGWSSVVESEVAATPTLGLLKTRPSSVSSFSDSIATTPLFLSAGAG